MQATIAPFAWSRFGGRLLQDLRLGGMQEEDGIQGRCAEFQVQKKREDVLSQRVGVSILDTAQRGEE